MTLNEISDEPTLIWMLKQLVKKDDAVTVNVNIKRNLCLVPGFEAISQSTRVEGVLNDVEVRGYALRKSGKDTFNQFPTFMLQVGHASGLEENSLNYFFLDAAEKLKLTKVADDQFLLTNK